MVFSANAIIGNGIGIALLRTEGLRVVLYVVMTVMCLNACVLQICMVIFNVVLPISVNEHMIIEKRKRDKEEGKPEEKKESFWSEVKFEIKRTFELILSKRFAPMILYSVYNGVLVDMVIRQNYHIIWEYYQI